MTREAEYAGGMMDKRLQTQLWRVLLVMAIGGIASSPFVSLSADDSPATETGLLTRESQHLRLTSDVDDPALLDDLVQSFDDALPQWLAFWNVPESRATNWKIQAYLMQNVDTFRRSGALPDYLPRFDHGYSTPHTVWIRYQDTTYYNRHLVLHEGVHSLAFELFGAGGPSWYMEGTAELLSLHRDRVPTPSKQPPSGLSANAPVLAQSIDAFTINQLPRNRLDTPGWGRYKIVARHRDAGTLPTLKSVLKLPTALNGEVEAYTWCWAASSLFTQSPESREAFLEAAGRGKDRTEAFTSEFYRDVADQWPVLSARWRLLLHDLDYGFDWSRHNLNLSTSDSRASGSPIQMSVTPDQAWQSVGVWFPKGAKLRFAAEGRCHVSPEWVSEPAGITLEYNRGTPLGQLQVCVLPIATPAGATIPRLDVRPVITRTDVARTIAESTNSSDSSTAVLGSQIIEIKEPSWVLLRINLPAGHKPIASVNNDSPEAYRVQIAPTR
ncbi:hypothetical protein [Rhodopirellula bahusiensis]|uniref:DUF1570 domain-containing protein n=1 Tax=Rhodopirellula bahusiensis TaxID=2014065 RepID=A0A2G1WE63_9BACT|nr:hypothetical protein [Rhodopirellula bahusiensis]PHQ37311.1 hypothetical protein CEE69_01425 [Rhodopirellula bahusiensis]